MTSLLTNNAAMTVLQRLTHDHPMTADAWRALGATATLAGRPDLAVDAYRHEGALAPDSPRPGLDMAAALLRLRKLDEARKAAAAALDLAFAPVFVANLVFTYSFRDTRTADMAFASNLLGAMVGGALFGQTTVSVRRGPPAG